MKGLGVKNHIHRYARNSQGRWQCVGLGCTHFMPSNVDETVLIGKKSICWGCGEEFELNTINMLDQKPKCNDCSELADLSDFAERKIQEALDKKKKDE